MSSVPTRASAVLLAVGLTAAVVYVTVSTIATTGAGASIAQRANPSIVCPATGCTASTCHAAEGSTHEGRPGRGYGEDGLRGDQGIALR